MTEAAARLIREIQNYQALNGPPGKVLSDAALSRSISMDVSTWSKIKNGKAPPGGKFLRHLSRIRELRLAVYEYMNNPEVKEDG